MDNVTSGLPTNPSLIWNAAALAGPKTYGYPTDYGLYGGMTAINEDDSLLVDTGLIPEGTLSGVYNIRIVWDTTLANGTTAMTLEIYGDGAIISGGELPIVAKSNSDVVGTRIVASFNADVEYQFKLVSSTLSGGTVYVDYIRLDPLPSGYMLADELGLSKTRSEGVEVVQKYSATVTNTTGTRECTQNLYFNREFDEAPTVLATTDGSGIVISTISYTTYAYVHYTHVDNYNWVTPINVKFVVIGVIYPDPPIMEI